MSYLLTIGLIGVLSGYLPALEGPDTPERAAAVDSLAALGAERVETLIGTLREVGWRAREGILDALARIGPASLPVLMHTARSHPRVDARRLAVRAVGRIGGEAARDSLLRILDTPDRDIVIKALGMTEDPSVAPVICRYLKDARVDVRRQAVTALGKTAGLEAVDRIIGALSDSHHSVRFAAAGALEAIGPQAAGALLKGTHRLSGPGRHLAIRTLGHFQYRPAAGVLKRELASRDWSLRAVAAEALAAVDGRACVGPLEEALRKEAHPFVRERIRSSLRLFAH